jgi:hypothetical protein
MYSTDYPVHSHHPDGAPDHGTSPKRRSIITGWALSAKIENAKLFLLENDHIINTAGSYGRHKA